MPERANSLAYAFLAGTLAAAAVLGVTSRVSAAAECLESPEPKTARPGHWFYHFDRGQNRKCWYFKSAEAPVSAPAPAAPAAAPAAAPVAAAPADPQPSALARFLSQAFAVPAPQNQVVQPQQQPQYSTPDTPVETAQPVAPKPSKPARTVRRERPQTVQAQPQPPATTGSASDDGRGQTQQVIDKTDKHDTPLDVAAREALFQDFMRWQMERNLFGRP